MQGATYRGWQASMLRYFYGMKVELITTGGGLPVGFCLVPGGQADLTTLYQLPFAFPSGSQVYADAAYTDYVFEDRLAQEGIQLQVQRKSNA